MAEPLAQRFNAQPLASAGGRVITSPFQFYTTGEDHLRVTSVNALAGARLTMRGRVVPTAGPIEVFEHDHVPNSDRTARVTTQPLQAGAVLNVDVFVSTGTPQRGQTFVIVQLVRGLGSAGIVLGTLLAGYVTSTQHLGWPGSPIESSLSGTGAIRAISGTNPAPGAEVSESVPTGARWRLISLLAVLNTNATVASRVPYLIAVSGGQNMLAAPPAASIPASFVQNVQWMTGYTTWVVGGTLAQAASLPQQLLLSGGSGIITTTENFQATDNWDAPRLLVEEWLEVN